MTGIKHALRIGTVTLRHMTTQSSHPFRGGINQMKGNDADSELVHTS